MSTSSGVVSYAGVEPALPGLPAATEERLIKEAVEAAFRRCDRIGLSPSMAKFALWETTNVLLLAVHPVLSEQTATYSRYKQVYAAVASAFYNDPRYVPDLSEPDDFTAAFSL
jgi:hypothetical protein